MASLLLASGDADLQGRIRDDFLEGEGEKKGRRATPRESWGEPASRQWLRQWREVI